MSKKKSARMSLLLTEKQDTTSEIINTIQAGIVLKGWEIKSIRAGRVNINESYAMLIKGEVWLVGSHISLLPSASTHVNTKPDNNRKLLLTATKN